MKEFLVARGVCVIQTNHGSYHRSYRLALMKRWVWGWWGDFVSNISLKLSSLREGRINVGFVCLYFEAHRKELPWSKGNIRINID